MTTTSRKESPFLDQVWEVLRSSPLVRTQVRAPEGIALPFGVEAPRNTFWIMSPARAEAIAEEAGVEYMSMRGTRLFDIPVLFSDSVPDPILAFDDPSLFHQGERK